MTTLDRIKCDGLSCSATSGRGNTDHAGWMSVNISEYERDRVWTRRADLCPVHAQTLLDVCGPIPRSRG